MLINLVLLGWIPCTLLLFAVLPPRRATIASLLIAWLFLPVFNIQVRGIPDLNKMSIAALSVLLGSTLFDGFRPLKTRPRWFDLPALVVCLCPIPTSIANGLGVYDGMSTALEATFRFGLFYWIGRTYFSDLIALRELAIGILVGGLIYIPLCAFEVIFSPQLHRIVYGFHAAKFHMALRMGGYRPSVFMETGLALGMWLSATTLLAIWMWINGSLKRFLGYSFTLFLPLYVITFLLSRAAGGYMAFAIGISVLMACRMLRSSWPMLALVAAIVIFLLVRGSGIWDGQQLIPVAESIFGADRASSLETRIRNDSMLAAKAREQLLFGWGGWSRFRVTNEFGHDVSITDSMWIIMFGQRGIVGLASVFALYLLPVVIVCRRFPPGTWSHPLVAPAIGCCALMCTFMIDCLLNDMPNPLFTLTAGALAGIRIALPVVPVPLAQRTAPPQQESWVY